MSNQVEIEVLTPLLLGRSREYAICADLYCKAWNFALPKVQRSIGVVDFEHEVEGEAIFLARRDEHVVGYLAVWEPDWFVHHLYVDPVAHGLGIGKKLVSHVLTLAVPEQLSLKCQVENIGAMAFYRAMGFEATEELGSDEYGEWVRLIKHNI